MTILKRLFAGAAAAAMLTGATASHAANPAASLSVTARAASPTANSSELGADVSRGTLISIGILAALVVIVLVAVGGGDDSPDSP